MALEEKLFDAHLRPDLLNPILLPANHPAGKLLSSAAGQRKSPGTRALEAPGNVR